MFQDANCPNDLASFYHSNFAIVCAIPTEVTGITNHLFGLDGFSTTGHTDKLAVGICDNGFNGFVQHVGTSVDGTQSGERLREFSKAIERINVRGFSIASHRRGV